MNVELLKRITIEPGKCGGRPCLRGMRMRVTDVLQLLSAGASHEEILADYPDLEKNDILAAIEYAAHQAEPRSANRRVKFVIDHQLPPALARFLEAQGHVADHVRELGLKTSDDATIWRHAVANELVVVSKDEGFFFFVSSPNAAAKLLWVPDGQLSNAVSA